MTGISYSFPMQEQWGLVLTDVPKLSVSTSFIPKLSVSASFIPNINVSYAKIPSLTVNR